MSCDDLFLRQETLSNVGTVSVMLQSTLPIYIQPPEVLESRDLLPTVASLLMASLTEVMVTSFSVAVPSTS